VIRRAGVSSRGVVYIITKSSPGQCQSGCVVGVQAALPRASSVYCCQKSVSIYSTAARKRKMAASPRERPPPESALALDRAASQPPADPSTVPAQPNRFRNERRPNGAELDVCFVEGELCLHSPRISKLWFSAIPCLSLPAGFSPLHGGYITSEARFSLRFPKTLCP
jgi:hypothetical protein